jgi:tetratricopeptide (TPR) repeat protein
MAHRLGDLAREARESNSLGIARREGGDVPEARALIERSLAIARRIGDRHREATALSNLVHLHMDVGDHAAAVEAAHRAVAADEALGDPWGLAISRCNLVVALLHSEGPERAHEHLRAVAADAAALGDIDLSIDVIDAAAAIWAGLGDADRSATLLGAAERQRELAGLPRPAPDQRQLDRFVEPVRESVGDRVWADALARGAALTVEQAVTVATSARTAQTTA